MKNIDSIKLASIALALLLMVISLSFAPWWSVLFAAMSAFIVAFAFFAKEKTAVVSTNAPQKNNETTIKPIKSTVTFADVAGIKDAKSELEEIVDYFKNPAKYRKFGVKLPKGILLTGEPGVGKTLMAKAVAGESGVNFFYASGSSFVHMFVGVGPKKVSELFATARRMAPAIIFIDEIDAVGKSRGAFRADERENTLNQLLTEMDGFESSSQVIVIAATNKIEMLDSALLRAGRFDRKIEISMPNADDRSEILAIHFANKPHRLNLSDVAKKCVGFSGASLATLANEAAINAIKRDGDFINETDIEAVKDKIIELKKTGEFLSDEMQLKLAKYQLAKAVVAKELKVRFDKVTLEGDFFYKLPSVATKDQLITLIRSYLAGSMFFEISSIDAATFARRDIVKTKELLEVYNQNFNPFAKLDISELVQLLANETKALIDLAKIETLAATLVAQKSIDFDIL